MKRAQESLGSTGPFTTSRRDFVQAFTALGLSPAMAEAFFSTSPAAGGVELPEAELGQPIMAEGKAGAVVLEQLKAMGLKYIFHTNTSGLDTILEAVDPKDVQVIMVTDEGQAVAVAHGYALASGELSFFMGSKVGVGNTISNLYNAWKDRTPMLVTFGRTGLGAQGGTDSFEEWDDHLAPTDQFSAWHWSCKEADTMPEIVRRAVRFAHTPPGAPVTLDFPADLLEQRITAPVYPLDPKAVRPAFHPSPDLVEQAARWLIEAQSPLFVVGGEITRGKMNQAIVALAEKLAVPVCQGDDLFCDFPTTHPLAISATPRVSLSRLRFPRSVDLVISFGSSVDALPSGARLIHVGTDADGIGRNVEADLPVLAHVSAFIPALSDAIDGLLTAERIKKIRTERWAAVSAYTGELRKSREASLRAQFDQTPLSWDRVGYELERVLDRNAVLVPELGSSENRILGQLSQGPDHKMRIGRSQGSALGWGVGAAFGTQLALPDRQVVSIQGDGGIMFGQTETLWTISRYDAPMLIVIMNNHSYNETRNRNLSVSESLFRSGQDLTSYLGNPDIDFTKIAEAYAIPTTKVRHPTELTTALDKAVKTMRDGRPFLLDIEIARDGMIAESTWHPEFSIAGLRTRRG